MSDNLGDLDQRIRVVLNECSDAVSFADRVAAASHSEQVAVGTDHLKMMEQAVRRAAAAFAALVERDAEAGLRSVVEPLPPQEVRDLEAVIRGLTAALGEAGERSAVTIQALESALAESRTALEESQNRGAAMAEALLPFAVTAGRAEMGYVQDGERLRLEKASEVPVSTDLRGRDFRRAASALAGSPRPEFGVTTVEALRDAWNEGLRYAMLEQTNKRTIAWDTASYAACYAYAERYATATSGRCPIGLGATPGICSAGTCSVCTAERYAAALTRVEELEENLARVSPPTEPVIDEHTVAAVAEAISNGGWWKSCSGCHETSEGCETGGYPFSKVFRCYVGAGCTECGGIGVVWEYYTSEQYDAMAREARGEPLVEPPPSDELDDLDRRLKERGMFTIGEMMGTTPLTSWQTHTGVQDLESFAGWLDSQVRQFLTMQAEYTLGKKGEEDELYAWVQAHSAALQSVRINFRAALARSAAPLLALVDELDRRAEFERLLTVDDGRRVAALARQLVAHLRETYPLPPRKED